MFDINFLKNSGILLESKIKNSNNISDEEKDISHIVSIADSIGEIDVKNNKSYLPLLVGFILFCLILSTIFYHNKSNIDSALIKLDISIENVLDIIRLDNSSTQINFIHFNKSNISFQIKALNANAFYSFLDNRNDNLKGCLRAIHKENDFFITGNIPWVIQKKQDFTINLLDKEISDFRLDLKKEIYKDKLIIVCNRQGAFELLNLIDGLNVINQFHLEIQEIYSVPGQASLFQIIIY
tara:strand:+ start:43613 stop:44329 length:717 start_codon:yes stop_codon:yes gene_type:complete